MDTQKEQRGITLQSLPFIGVLAFLFGSQIVASRFAVGQMHAIVFVGLRLSIAAIGHILLFAFRGWPSDRRLWMHAALYGVLTYAIGLTAVVTALHYVSSGVASLLLTLYPVVVVLFAHFFLPAERLTGGKTFGVGLALGGAALLALRGESGLPYMRQASRIGYGLILLTVLIGGAMVVYARKFMRDFDALDVAGVEVIAATVAIVPVMLLFTETDLSAVNIQGYFALIYAALFGTFLAMLLEFSIIKSYGATAVAMTAYVSPIVAGVGGVLLLGEAFTWAIFVGMALILLGITIVQREGS